LKDGLEILYKLQQNDDRINETEIRIREIPENIKTLEADRDSKADIVNKSKDKLEENLKGRQKLEGEIQLIREKITKHREQLNKSTTNKEYQGFIAEIKNEEKRILEIEEKIIEEMLKSDEVMEEVRESEGEFNKIAGEYNKRIEDLKQNLEYNKSKLEEEKKNRDELRKTIPQNLLSIYDNLVKNREGKAISFVETNFCGICNVKIRPQRLSELISTNDIFICENCGRILYKEVIEEEKREN
jgi:predicted  nucleic acid-binding Zn-ribbon protein